MNTTKKPLAVAVSTAPGYVLGEHDANRLAELILHFRMNFYNPRFVTYEKDANRPFLDTFSKAEKMIHPQVITSPKASRFTLGKNVRPDDARLLVLIAGTVVRVGEGGKIAEEAEAADVPVWKFTPTPK